MAVWLPSPALQAAGCKSCFARSRKQVLFDSRAILRLAGRDIDIAEVFDEDPHCKETVLDVNKKPCYIILDPDTAHKSTAEIEKEKNYVLPDENTVTTWLLFCVFCVDCA